MTSDTPISYHRLHRHNSQPHPPPALNTSHENIEPKSPQSPRSLQHVTALYQKDDRERDSSSTPGLSVILATFEDWWLWEVAGLLGSGIALAAVVVLLKHFDQHEQPDWNDISLNTVVSWLSTVAKLLALIPLSKSLGQLKWTWLARNEKSMADLAAFDSASRGAVGACQLLWTTKARSV